MTSFKDCVRIAKQLTKHYAENHVGRNALEKECLRKGYIIKRWGRFFQIVQKVKRTNWYSLRWISTRFIARVALQSLDNTSLELFILLTVLLSHFLTVQFLKYCLISELVERNFHIFLSIREVEMKGERYKIGDAVIHQIFGYGLIVDKFVNKNWRVILIVKFDSLETNRNILANFYGIKKVCK